MIHMTTDPPRRRAFSFVEVLFAVMVLGIGFILIAAMLPMLIVQTQATMDDDQGASVARGSIATLQIAADDDRLAPLNQSGTVTTAPLGGDMICAANPRYAWTALVRRKESEPFAQVIVIVARSRNRPTFTADDLRIAPDDISGMGPNLSLRSVYVTLEKGDRMRPGRIRFRGDSAGALGAPDLGATQGAAAAGAFVVIGNDNADGRMNGRIYQLGTQVEAGTWDLAPGWDMNDAAENLDSAQAFILGRGYANPARPADGFAGPAMDVAIYATIVRVND